jgi:hypothetical protein
LQVHQLLAVQKEHNGNARWFATMNPNYQGRMPLPDIQQKEGRSVMFSLPAYERILVVHMAREGIVDAQKLGPMLDKVFIDSKE